MFYLDPQQIVHCGSDPDVCMILRNEQICAKRPHLTMLTKLKPNDILPLYLDLNQHISDVLHPFNHVNQPTSRQATHLPCLHEILDPDRPCQHVWGIK